MIALNYNALNIINLKSKLTDCKNSACNLSCICAKLDSSNAGLGDRTCGVECWEVGVKESELEVRSSVDTLEMVEVWVSKTNWGGFRGLFDISLVRLGVSQTVKLCLRWCPFLKGVLTGLVSRDGLVLSKLVAVRDSCDIMESNDPCRESCSSGSLSSSSLKFNRSSKSPGSRVTFRLVPDWMSSFSLSSSKILVRELSTDELELRRNTAIRIKVFFHLLM